MHTLIGKKAPIFSTTAVIDRCSIVQDFSLEQFFIDDRISRVHSSDVPQYLEISW
jgi:hypothetical protein